MEPQYIAATIMVGLGAVAWYLIVRRFENWETRMAAQDARLDKHAEKHIEHDTNHARFDERLHNIKETVDETHDDVKELLKQSNGRRSQG